MPAILLNSRVYVAGADLTGTSNKIALDVERAELDATTFGGAGWTQNESGLGKGTAAVTGFWAAGDAGQPDDRFYADLGVNQPLTVVPNAANSTVAVADLAYLLQIMQSKYMMGGTVGELVGYDVAYASDSPVVRGQVMHDPGTARTATGNGTAVQLGAVTASQRVYCSLHLISVSGTTPSLTAKLQSAATAGGSYTDRVTFTAATALGGQFASAAGAITDTWWRLQWTISGTLPSFLLVAAAGITTP